MSDADNAALVEAALEGAADFEAPLSRVSYQPGMLLGVEAARAEQDYHRRQRQRHSYWLHGAGTVAGLRVVLEGLDPVAPDDLTTASMLRLVVTPGVGIDGLGREVTLREPYCLDLGRWIKAKQEDQARDGWGELKRDGLDPGNLLWLKVTLRYQESPSALQPVLATAVNAGTDPVQPARLKDGVLLELLPERPEPQQPPSPFASHGALPSWEEVAAELAAPDREAVQGASGEAQQQLQLAARLLYAIPDDSEGLARRNQRSVSPAEAARVLLARVSLQLTPEGEALLNPNRVQVHNLGRPFVLNARLIAQLMQG